VFAPVGAAAALAGAKAAFVETAPATDGSAYAPAENLPGPFPERPSRLAYQPLCCSSGLV